MSRSTPSEKHPDLNTSRSASYNKHSFPQTRHSAPSAKTWALRFFTASPLGFSWRTRRLDGVLNLHCRELGNTGPSFSSPLCICHPPEPAPETEVHVNPRTLHSVSRVLQHHKRSFGSTEAAPERNTNLEDRLPQISCILTPRKMSLGSFSACLPLLLHGSSIVGQRSQEQRFGAPIAESVKGSLNNSWKGFSYVTMLS